MIDINEIIVYIDDSIVVVDKPSGLRTIPDGYDLDLLNLQSLLKNKFQTLFTIHRLDKETSGLVIFAFNKDVHKNLNFQFEQRLIQKSYLAITHNIPEWVNYSAEFPLKINGDRKHRTIIDVAGKNSHTVFKKVQSNQKSNLTLLEAQPRTGYTHQIRTHLSFLGFPIFGDILYSRGLSASQKERNKKANRMMLHANSITFFHPQKNQEMTFESKIPFILEDN